MSVSSENQATFEEAINCRLIAATSEQMSDQDRRHRPKMHLRQRREPALGSSKHNYLKSQPNRNTRTKAMMHRMLLDPGILLFLSLAITGSAAERSHQDAREATEGVKFEVCKTQLLIGQQLINLSQIVFQPSEVCSSWLEMATQMESSGQQAQPWQHIEQLNLSHNNLTKLANSSAFKGLAKLSELRISYNQLVLCEEASLSGLGHLKILDLSHNKLLELPATLFDSLLQLEKLDLSSNALTSVSSRLFEQLVHLRHLDLSSNGLKSLAPATFSALAQLESLNLEWNPWESLTRGGLGALPATLRLLKLENAQPGKQSKSPVASPVLRPSLEEVASKLSRKYLNLEQHKHNAETPPPSPSIASVSGQTTREPAGKLTELQPAQAATSNGNEAEQEITLVSPSTKQHLLAAEQYVHFEPSSFSSVATADGPAVTTATTAASAAEAEAPSSLSSGKNKPNRASQRRKKVNANLSLQTNEAEGELRQCQHYLQSHQSSYLQGSPARGSNLNDDQHTSSSIAFDHLSFQSAANQPISCSCDNRQHFALPTSSAQNEPIWLNCDNIQLIGGGQFVAGERKLPNESPTSHSDGQQLVRFSQRDSGLQVLLAQKFHYLQLFHLKSIDLARNRLREIKMDAFHGLESSLEHLNLANNLLGDSRTSYAPATSGSSAVQRRGTFTFHSDELSRLFKLKWLSLKDNQIGQLSANIFARNMSAKSRTIQGGAESELVHLDLSENLLSTIPSASIRPLNKLQVLKLNKNRIAQLDHFSSFPSSLQYLDLSNNLISSIRNCDLIDLANLVEIDLSHNLLRQMDMNSFVSSSSSYLAAAAAAAANHEAEKVYVASGEGQRGGEMSSLHGEVEENSGQLASRWKRQAQIEEANTLAEEIEVMQAEESSFREGQQSEAEELETNESIFSTLKSRLGSNGHRPVEGGGRDEMLGEEANPTLKIQHHFNGTLRLNLSYNLFDSIPGDTLLKFSRLQVLDLSFNRIRSIDSNYFCSIYSLVEHLRHLDLSGNLLTLDGEGGDTGAARSATRQLNKLFGCLQRLEKLMLSTNRLAASSLVPSEMSAVGEHRQEAEVDTASDRQGDNTAISEDQILADGSEQHQAREAPDSREPEARLHIKFGESFGSRLLNTLDLGDNQLRVFPIIERVAAQQPPIVSSEHLGEGNRTQQLDEWMMNSRVHLEVLSLKHNYLERLEEREFEHLFNLRQLHLDFNKINALPLKLMRRFTGIELLSVAGNRLSALEPLNELFERSIRSLRVLNLANNRLMRWPDIRKLFVSQEAHNSATQEAQQRRIEDASDMLAQQQQQPLPKHNMIDFALEELNLEGNLLTSHNISSLFDQLTYMKSLRTLNLNFNLLNKIRSDWFKFANKNLQHLHLTGNKINSIDLGAFALNQVDELTLLNLDFNLMKELKRKTFDSMPKIRELNLGHNLIHTINSESFHQLNSLQVLKLNNNKLTSWKCEYFSHLCNSISGNINVDLASLLALANQQQQVSSVSSSLVELDLSHNSLSQLRANSIAAHTRLTRLNLAHNKLSFIPHDLFKATTLVSATGGRQVHLVSSLRYLNLAHNRIQTIDNINFKPLRNLVTLDLSHNELQALGVDVVLDDGTKPLRQGQQNEQKRPIIVSGNNLTNLLMESETSQQFDLASEWVNNKSSANRTGRALGPSDGSGPIWPGLCKLRHLNLAHNVLTQVNQSILADLSPFVALNLNLSWNLLDSASLPMGFFTKMHSHLNGKPTGYELVFTMKIESIDLSHNKLSEYPNGLLDNHYSSMESCNLSHNRIQILPQNSNSMVQIKWLNLEFNPLNRESSELILYESRSVRSLNLAATRLYAIQQAIGESNALRLATQSRQKARTMVNQTSHLDLIRSISRPIDAPYLRHLNLSSNQLVWLAASVFERLTSLQTLDLSSNQLTRLHLLNNQLAHVALSLEHLNLGSNLFTNIDQSDLNQLVNIRQLDLSNLLSLQKLNCKFLARFSALQSLKMFNYPQLRHHLQALINSLHSSPTVIVSDRLKQKVLNELLMSTVGGHCFQDTLKSSSQPVVALASEPSEQQQLAAAREGKWFDLEELELELFNDFTRTFNRGEHASIGGFRLGGQLLPLLGPSMRKLTLTGLNVTSISDYSLFGITNEELTLKISYTSLSQLPLKQILSSVAKRTKLNLDLRNNNIQTIDMNTLQWLDELQQITEAARSPAAQINGLAATTITSTPILQLASNPFRCDCHVRPLWLWLNKRWENVDIPQGSDDQLGETSTGNSANYWLKSFHAQTSDLRCFYPLKLRFKLAQHVHYNDLVCKSSPPTPTSGSTSTSASSSRSMNRKRANETFIRSSESYYQTSLIGGDSNLDDLDEDSDYFYNSDDAAAASDLVPGANYEPPVRVTRFNRYPSATSNSTSLYFINNFPTVPFLSEASRGDAQWPQSDHQETTTGGQSIGHTLNHKDKRDKHSIPLTPGEQQHGISTKYNKHRPNTSQRHSHFSTMSGLQGLPAGHSVARGSGSKGDEAVEGATGHAKAKHSMLTEFDLMVLTASSIAMTVMAFVIMGTCVFRYRYDRAEEEQILSSRLVMSQALLEAGVKSNISRGSNGTASFESTPNSSANSSKSARRASKEEPGGGGDTRLRSSGGRHEPQQTSSKQRQECPERTKLVHQHHYNGPPPFGPRQYPVLIPVHGFATAHQNQVFANGKSAGQNFLMRSPTIRRMHGLASNAGDFLKYTLRAYPSSSGTKRRRLFMRNSLSAPGVSQLTTSKMAAHIYQQQELLHGNAAALIAGCPTHAFDGLCKLKEFPSDSGDSTDKECLHCNQLLLSFRQTKVRSLRHLTGQAGVEAAAQSDREVEADEEGQGQKSVSSLLLQQAQGGGYMPPKMIQALARQLDERHLDLKRAGRPLDCGDQRQTKALRSFGATRGQAGAEDKSDRGKHFARIVTTKASTTSSSSLASSSTSAPSVVKRDRQHHQSPSTKASAIDNGVPSQIPTVDVDGRFSYQTDSQIEAHLADLRQTRVRTRTETDTEADSEAGRSYVVGATPSSTVATGQEDIFILVRDTPSQLTVSSKSTTGAANTAATAPTNNARNAHTRQQSGHTATTLCADLTTFTSAANQSNQRGQRQQNDASSNSNVMGDVGSIMQDECSRSSSPIAYGFMRSSPSATTISSNTMTTSQQNHYIVNRSPELATSVVSSAYARFAQTKRSSFLGSESAKAKYQRQIVDSNNNDSNQLDGNNNDIEYVKDYSAIRQDQQLETNTDDQIIISRL